MKTDVFVEFVVCIFGIDIFCTYAMYQICVHPLYASIVLKCLYCAYVMMYLHVIALHCLSHVVDAGHFAPLILLPSFLELVMTVDRYNEAHECGLYA